MQDKETQRHVATTSQPPVARMIEDIVGCKWSLAVLQTIRNRILRPGAIQRSIEGISTKVLNERLTKMVRYGILVKESYLEVPPRVEYRLTRFGAKFLNVLDQIEMLQKELLARNKSSDH